MSDWEVVGRQKYRVEDDLIVWDGTGDISVEELSTIFNRALAVQEVFGYTLVVIMPHEPWSFPPEARKFLSQFHRQHKAVGVTAIVGISATMTLFIDLVLRAIGRVSGHRPTTRFFRTYAEAMIWIEEQRVLGKKGLLTH